MRVHVHFRLREKRRGEYRSGNRILSLAYSLLLHAGVVVLLFAPPRGSAPDRPLYQSVIVPLQAEHKIIYYNLRDQLPEVSPSNPTKAETKLERRAKKAPQTIITAPRARDGKQFVYIPAPKIKLRTELQAPNIIAFQPPTIPAPEKPKPKAFQAPPAESPPVHAATIALPAAPTLATSRNEQSALNEVLRPTAPRKQFVMPAAKEAAGRGAPATLLPAAPELAGGTSQRPNNPLSDLIRPTAPKRQFVMPAASGGGATTALPSAVPAPPTLAAGAAQPAGNSLDELIKAAGPRRQFVAPPAPHSGAGGKPGAALPAPPTVQESGPAATASLAIISLTPANAPRIPTPEGGRPERVSAGPQVSNGPRAELGKGNSPITVPDVAIQGNATHPAQTASIITRGERKAPGVAVPRMPAPPARTFESSHVSVPQWPNKRSLPTLIEQHFRNRVVYMSVLPGQQVDADWIVWFGEQEATPPGEHVLVRPPSLLQPAALPAVPAQDEHGTGTLRVAGIIRKDGRLDSCRGLAGSTVDAEMIGALQNWQFKPATRNGVAVDVDAVLEIPVLFATAKSR